MSNDERFNAFLIDDLKQFGRSAAWMLARCGRLPLLNSRGGDIQETSKDRLAHLGLVNPNLGYTLGGVSRGATHQLDPPALRACDLHAIDQDRADGLGAVVVSVGAQRLQAQEHVLEIAGDGDLLHRKSDFALLYPKATRAA